MHPEKSVCLYYMTALWKASLKVATMQRNISGIFNVMRNFIPYPLLANSFVLNSAFTPASMKLIGRKYALCSQYRNTPICYRYCEMKVKLITLVSDLKHTTWRSFVNIFYVFILAQNDARNAVR